MKATSGRPFKVRRCAICNRFHQFKLSRGRSCYRIDCAAEGRRIRESKETARVQCAFDALLARKAEKERKMLCQTKK